MDSISQIALGASVAALVAPPGHRRRALLLGAALGTLPDLDVLIRYGDPIEDFTRHRSFSHSLLVLPWAGFLLWGAWLWMWRVAREARGRWLLAIQLALLTHPLLDAFTVYGTQLFLPLDVAPTMIGSVFIIDPLYTVWLIIGIAAAWRLREHPRAGFWLTSGLAMSCAYLGWGVLAQRHIESAMRADLEVRGLSEASLLVTPTPLNSIAWRIVVQRPDGDYYEGWYSFLADRPDIRLDPRQGRHDLVEPIFDSDDVQRLQWFTHGFYAADLIGSRVVIKDLRMGEEGLYVFRFAVGEQHDGNTRPIVAEQLPWPTTVERARLETLWSRIGGRY
jgi:inner membrane protein